MQFKMYQVDAFTDTLFKGNPAAVCFCERWPAEHIMQQVARENSLSETAFVLSVDGCREIRWFSPLVEIDLCGHATLAAGFLLMELLEPGLQKVQFHSPRSGPLTVERQGDCFNMDFPAQTPEPCAKSDDLVQGIGCQPLEVLRADDYLVVLEKEAEVRSLKPDFSRLVKLPGRGVIVTAPGDTVDFVSRFFGPKVGIPEDPVTGSAHCELTPYWSRRLGKQKLQAVQVSERGGQLWCEEKGARVGIAGQAVLYLTGEIFLPDHD